MFGASTKQNEAEYEVDICISCLGVGVEFLQTRPSCLILSRGVGVPWLLTQTLLFVRYDMLLQGKTTMIRTLLSVPGQRLELHDGSETSADAFRRDPESLCSRVTWEDQEERIKWIYMVSFPSAIPSQCFSLLSNRHTLYV